jgi:hypothetical protein
VCEGAAWFITSQPIWLEWALSRGFNGLMSDFI